MPIFVEAEIPCFLDVRLRKNELAVRSIENVEHPVTIGLHKDVSFLAGNILVRQYQIFVGVPVMRVARRELVVPLSRARGWIESDHGTGKQVIALANGSVQAGARVAHGPIEYVQIGIIAARQPCAAAAVFPAVPVPGLVTKFAWSGDGVEAPQPLTGGRVVRIDEAANAKFSSGDPHDDLVFDRQGRSSNGIALEGVGHLGFPKHTSGAGIQRDQRSVERAKEHAATQYSRAAIEGVYLVRTYYLLPSLKFPNLKSC